MKDLTNSILLNRSEAAHILHLLHKDLLLRSGIKNTRPDFYSILIRITRLSKHEQAVSKVKTRGSIAKYGEIQSFKIDGRHMYDKQTLRAWFINNYAPKALLAA